LSDPTFFHEASETVRFWVDVGGREMGASVGRAALHHRYRPSAQGEDPLDTFRENRADIEAAVRRRVAQGSIEPVMLREYDLRMLGPT
jgi:hypothetical protein